ncbi:TPA: hypothetical protein DEG21_05820 [Patescibacteria group bacterium]|nr:hypothetical protein [Candidatus Gracilibacteria bacterium]
MDDDNDEFSISLTILENIKEEFYENEYIFEKAIIRNTNIPNKQLSFNSLSETFSYIEDIKISKLNTHIKNLNDFEILINYKEK